MTELLSGVEAPSDAELISRVRGGDVTAYGELFARHVEAARRLGRQLVRGPDVDDLVSDAFAKTLTVLQGGGGPDVAFRAYLLTSVRRLHVDRIRAAKKFTPADDMTVFDDGEPFRDTAVAEFENGAAAKAFASLPERWQLVLWHLEVEGQKPADIAPLLGMSANSVSALAYRAREGLRQAFLTMHLADSATDQCRWVNQHLGAYVRKGLSKRDVTKVEAHLDECRRCTAMYLELTEVNSNLSALIAPLVLGAAAAGYLGSAGGVGATGLSGFLGRVRDTFGGRSGSGSGSATGSGGAGAGSAGGGVGLGTGGMVAVGGVAAAGIAAVVTAALVLGGASKEVITEAEQPVGTPTVAAAPGQPVEADGPEKPAADPVDTVEPVEPVEPVDTAVAPGETVAGVPPEVPAAVDEVTPDEPVTDDTGTTDTPPAGTTDPGTSDPGTSDPGTSDPGTTDPGTTDPGTTDPGTTDPGTTDPPPAEPGEDDPSPALPTISVSAPIKEGQAYKIAVLITNLPAGAKPQFGLVGATHAEIQGWDDRTGPFVVRVRMSQGVPFGLETVALKVTVGSGDRAVSRISEFFTLGRERNDNPSDEQPPAGGGKPDNKPGKGKD